MKNIFISQPMNGKTDEEIAKDREKAISYLYDTLGYKPEDIHIIDSMIKEETDALVPGLWYLGKSIELLAEANIAIFTPGWEEARGCNIEYNCAKEYGIICICIPKR